MKTRILAPLIALTLLASPVWALMTHHGRERIESTGWSEGLSAIINHPARVCGYIGPFGPTSRFHYSGDAMALNHILVQYRMLPGNSRVLYLHPEEAPVVEGFQKDEPHDFDVSITVSGQGYIHLYTLGRIKLEELKIPDGIEVEPVPVLAMPEDPAQRAKLVAEQQRVAKFIIERKSK